MRLSNRLCLGGKLGVRASRQSVRPIHWLRLFDADSLPMSATSELSPEKALRLAKDQHTAYTATASTINTSMLSYILKLAFGWISDRIQS